MDVYIGEEYGSILFVATSDNDSIKIQQMANELSGEQFRKHRILCPVIPGQLYHVRYDEKF